MKFGMVVFSAYLWYPALKRPAWEGPGIDSDIMRGRVRDRCDGGGYDGGDVDAGSSCAGVFLGARGRWVCSVCTRGTHQLTVKFKKASK